MLQTSPERVYLNDQDLQQLFIYHLSDARLVEVASEGRSFISIDKLFPGDDFVVLFGLDKNQDGTFKRGSEPMFFYKLNLQNGSTELLVGEEDIQRLQERLDGRMR